MQIYYYTQRTQGICCMAFTVFSLQASSYELAQIELLNLCYMKVSKHLLLLFLIVSISSCKDEEPFEYPEDPVEIDPTWITELEREVKSDEGWIPMQSAENCNPNLNINNLASYELNYDRGFAIMQLLPSDSTCAVSVTLETSFKENEISNFDWDELNFEYTYSEYNGDSNSVYLISLNYKNLELDIDLAPIIAEMIPEDTTDGLFKLSFESDEPVFELNGKRFNPDFGNDSDNFISLDGSGTENYFRAMLGSVNSEGSTYTAFQFLRISRFGIEES